jgi:hypothetical protein
MRLALCRWRARTPLPSGASAAWEPDIDIRAYRSVGAIDLGHGRDGSGFCVVGVPDADAPIAGAVLDLGDDRLASVGRKFSNAIGRNVYERRVGRAVRELLVDLVPERSGRERVEVAGIQLYDSLGNLPHELRAAYFSEHFNKPDGTGLGPQLSWDNETGNWNTFGGKARHNEAVYHSVRANNADVGGPNMYAQAVVRFPVAGGYSGGVMLRMLTNSNAQAYSGFIDANHYAEIAYHDAFNAYNFVASASVTVLTNTDYLVYAQADGSTLSLSRDGVQLCSATNTLQATGQHGGILIYQPSLLPNQVLIDNFATALIGETAPSGSALAHRRARLVPGMGGRW